MEEENDAKGIGTNLRMFLPIMGNNRFVMHKVSSIKSSLSLHYEKYLPNHCSSLNLPRMQMQPEVDYHE